MRGAAGRIAAALRSAVSSNSGVLARSGAAAAASAASFSAAAAESVAAARSAAGSRWGLLLSGALGVGVVTAGYCFASSVAVAEADGGSGASPGSSAGSAAGGAGSAGKPDKVRVVVLGTGWGNVSFLKHLDPKAFSADGPYELTVISPRSYFLYTPLLPAAASGSVQEASIMQPVRELLRGQGTFFLAKATEINPERRVVKCCVRKCEVCKSAEHERGCPRGKQACEQEQAEFEVPYDVLLLGVGSINNTFGIKGVEEHCFFLKSIDDSRRLRTHISQMIEHAGLPHLSPEERKRHLDFLVVGGGPTGVELAAELHDLVKEDVSRLVPHLKQDVKITVVDTMDHLLGAFDRELSEYTANHFLKEGIDVQLGTMVRSVGDGCITVKRGDKEEQMPFGTCVWATGIAMNPLVRGLKESLQRRLAEVQNSRTGVVVDGHLRVRGTNGTIYCVGDAAVTHQETALAMAPKLFASADQDKDQRISYKELVALLRRVRRRFTQLGELAELLEEGVLEKAARGLWGQSSKAERYSKHIERLKHGLAYEEFEELLKDADTLMRSLPPTAQVASQEGKFLAQLFSKHPLQPMYGPPPPNVHNRNEFIPEYVPVPKDANGVEVPMFQFRYLGSFAYVGVDKAVLSLPSKMPFSALKGWLVGLTWRGFETWGQISMRNKVMVTADWMKTKIWGRAVSEH